MSNLTHLEWAINSRAENQRHSLALLKLLEEHSDKWKSKRMSRAAQKLVAIAFSLWRAAFLADKTAKREAVFTHAKDFLRQVIEDNTISYLADRKAKEWTFNYYVDNARFSLEELAKRWSEIVPLWQPATRAPTVRWEYANSLLNTAVQNFKKRFEKEERIALGQLARKSRRQTRKANRRKVRALSR